MTLPFCMVFSFVNQTDTEAILLMIMNKFNAFRILILDFFPELGDSTGEARSAFSKARIVIFTYVVKSNYTILSHKRQEFIEIHRTIMPKGTIETAVGRGVWILVEQMQYAGNIGKSEV